MILQTDQDCQAIDLSVSASRTEGMEPLRLLKTIPTVFLFHWLMRRQTILTTTGTVSSFFKIHVGISSVITQCLSCGLWFPHLVTNVLDWVELWMWLEILLPLCLNNSFQCSTTVLILLHSSVHCIQSQVGIFFIDDYFKESQTIMTGVVHSCPQRKYDF